MGKHDTNFKNLILDYLRAALLFFAGVEARRLPKNAVLTAVSEARLRNWLCEKGAIQDVVVKVEFPNGEREMLVFCIEHNSRERKNILKRQAKYCIQASIDLKTDRVVPIAIFPNETRTVKEQFKLSTEHGVYMDFRCITVKLKELEARRFLKSKNIVARLCLPFMKFGKTKKLEAVDCAWRGLKQLEKDGDKREKYSGFLSQYAPMTVEERALFESEYVEDSPYKEDYMTIWKQAETKGRAEGEAKGEARGEARGEAKGKAELIVELFNDGTFTAKQAVSKLRSLIDNGKLPREIGDNALKQIHTKS